MEIFLEIIGEGIMVYCRIYFLLHSCIIIELQQLHCNFGILLFYVKHAWTPLTLGFLSFEIFPPLPLHNLLEQASPLRVRC